MQYFTIRSMRSIVLFKHTWPTYTLCMDVHIIRTGSKQIDILKTCVKGEDFRHPPRQTESFNLNSLVDLTNKMFAPLRTRMSSWFFCMHGQERRTPLKAHERATFIWVCKGFSKARGETRPDAEMSCFDLHRLARMFMTPSAVLHKSLVQFFSNNFFEVIWSTPVIFWIHNYNSMIDSRVDSIGIPEQDQYLLCLQWVKPVIPVRCELSPNNSIHNKGTKNCI